MVRRSAIRSYRECAICIVAAFPRFTHIVTAHVAGVAIRIAVIGNAIEIAIGITLIRNAVYVAVAAALVRRGVRHVYENKPLCRGCRLAGGMGGTRRVGLTGEDHGGKSTEP